MPQELTDPPSPAKLPKPLALGLFTLLLALVALLIPVVDWAPTGGLVGWLLFLAGCAELALSFGRGGDLLGRISRISGLLAAAAGAAFIARPFAGYFPVANIVMAWLLVRGAIVLAMAFRHDESRTRNWLLLSAIADLLLGGVLLVGLPVSLLVVGLFGPTPEIVSRFSLILAASFLVAGISQLAIGVGLRK